MNISIIIPWRRSPQPDRNQIGQWCFVRYRQLFPNAEIISSDSDDKVFSRGKSINKGVKECSGDYIVITDADYIFSSTMAKEIVNKQPWTVAVKSENYCFLNQIITNKILNEDPNNFILKNYNSSLEENCNKSPYNVYGGLLAMPKENFLKVQFDPWFKGYGYEDEAFYYAMKAFFGKEFRTNNKMYHFNHSRVDNNGYGQYSFINRDYYNKTYKPIIYDRKALREYVNNYNKDGTDK
jgi:predicted glycosyltransferase involved in capsule biosynthesis